MTDSPVPMERAAPSAPSIAHPPRPRSLVVIRILATVGGIVDIVGGSMLLVLATSAGWGPQPIPGGAVTALAALIGGILGYAVAPGLAHGDRRSRLVTTIARSATALAALLALVSQTIAAIPAILSILITASILLGIWLSPRNALFAYRRSGRPQDA